MEGATQANQYMHLDSGTVQSTFMHILIDAETKGELAKSAVSLMAKHLTEVDCERCANRVLTYHCVILTDVLVSSKTT